VNARTPDDTTVKETPANEPESRPPQWWPIAGAIVVSAFIASVVLSTRSASVPVAASGAMNAGTLALTMRDANNQAVGLPDGRPAVVIVAQATGCAPCVAAVRAAGDAIKQANDRAQLIVALADPKTSRAGLAAFTRAVGSSPARYVIRGPTSSLAAALGNRGVGGAVVYDAHGRVVSRPLANSRQILAALRHADQ